ncbi:MULTISPECIES: hypothetical protein [unclassified Tolypothrix]|uniref:hypothetical protein n=1 Tax=unclassified Tolypothrix TaxID=2649714 RepID=UPI0012D72772|nr:MULTISPECIES: hypothetical protein [unclassified Tolypothrix]MBE9084931.1 hypothetical protein [Tolypothrix sp. LEGE 11397]UYD31144.1 hypothetical protein HGR01_40410 [Tolypothrix sp. PCC 7712]UYD38940.1 hypothetical protein HG267_41350 [Tolypothrix sp. PCC 7601]
MGKSQVEIAENESLTTTLEEETASNKSENSLEVLIEVLKNPQEILEKLQEAPVRHWMDIAAPILQSGGKPVAIILSLGFVAIPLIMGGSYWVAPIIAVGASIVAICSCLN